MNPIATRTHRGEDATDPSTRTGRTLPVAATAGGLALFCDLSLHAFRPLHQSHWAWAAGAAITATSRNNGRS